MSQKAAARDLVKEGLLDAMDTLLVRFGYQKTTVDDLASEAGIGKGTIYLYFNSKEQVALSCIDRFHERLIIRLNEIANGDGSSKVKITEVLKTRVMARFDYCKDSYSFDEMLAALHKELLCRRDRFHAEEAEVIEQILLNGAKSGELPSCDARGVAEAMILATNSLMPYSRKGGQIGSCDAVEENIVKLSAVLIDGIAGLPQTAHAKAGAK
jgi:TetR/AcrR family fatty acid metabolism transcriptional regulator